MKKNDGINSSNGHGSTSDANSESSVTQEANTPNNQASSESVTNDRRKAVKNILAGTTLATGAATSGTWVKPAVDAVMTPAHAQTSTTVVLSGNARLTIGPRSSVVKSPTDSVLDMFINSANAVQGPPNFDGACTTVTFNITQGTFRLIVTFFDNIPDFIIDGTLQSGGNFSGTSQDVSIEGIFNSSANEATGTLTIGLATRGPVTYSFTITDSNTLCVALPPTSTTTTSTGYPTTGYPTTGYPTTISPTTGGPTTNIPTTGGPTTFTPTTSIPTTTVF